MRGKQPLVVVVDDEPAILHALRRELRGEPWKIQFFSDPLHALEAIRQDTPQVVISDHLMPQMTGAELLERIQAEFPTTRKFMFTGSMDKEPHCLVGRNLELDGVIKKPWDRSLLVRAVNRALEGPE